MSWRDIQLGQDLCDQDLIILDLFKDTAVKYVGPDIKFSKLLNTSDTATNLILILNQPQWCSNIIRTCQTHLTDSINNFYIGINRYTILGNDTTRSIKITKQQGINCVELLNAVVNELGFGVTQSGTFDDDLGRHFNFVQPLTWVYGNKITDKSN